MSGPDKPQQSIPALGFRVLTRFYDRFVSTGSGQYYRLSLSRTRLLANAAHF